jgi:hypothetical protein
MRLLLAAAVVVMGTKEIRAVARYIKAASSPAH